MSTRISVKLNDSGIEEMLQNLATPQKMLEIHNEFAKYCDPYVPFLEGPLSQTIEVTPDYVMYTQPYAHRQYYGEDFNHTKDYHPLASAKWDQAMFRDKKDEFLKQVAEILTRKAN